MLFDRGVTAKSRPWSSASSVPLVCAGPNIAKNAVVTSPVSTVDLGPTFLDFAGVLSSAPPGMSITSMVSVMQEPSVVAPSRKVVSFGLNNFRGVVQAINATTVLKFFCCSAHHHSADPEGQSGNGCPGSTPADKAGFDFNKTDEYHLYNIAKDRFETPASDLRLSQPEIVKEMAALLPPPHETAPNPDSYIPNQAFGYRWPGCTIL